MMTHGKPLPEFKAPRYQRRAKRQSPRSEVERALAELREMWRPPADRYKASTDA